MDLCSESEDKLSPCCCHSEFELMQQSQTKEQNWFESMSLPFSLTFSPVCTDWSTVTTCSLCHMLSTLDSLTKAEHTVKLCFWPVDEQSENKPHTMNLKTWQNRTTKSMCGLNLTTILFWQTRLKNAQLTMSFTLTSQCLPHNARLTNCAYLTMSLSLRQ